MSDFLVVGSVLFKVSDITEIKSSTKRDGWLVVATHNSRTHLNPQLAFDDRYLESTLRQAGIAKAIFITFEEAYEWGVHVMDDEHYETQKQACEDCVIDEDLCTKDHYLY
jgi:hypothetical protein